MTFDDMLGRTATLPIRRFGSPGAFLAVDANDLTEDAPTVLLIGREIPEGAKVGDELSVFVYLDSQARPIATTRTPKLTLGQVAFLEVTDVTSFGAFVDWGLDKELLVPLGEQTADMRVGGRYFVGLYVDEKTQRLTGTMKVGEMLGKVPPKLALDTWVSGEAWRNDPEVGLFVILEREFVGLLPASEPHALARGEAATFRIANVLPDGKVELTLRRHAHEEMESDAQKILDTLSRAGAIRVGDRSSPEEIRAVFGLSKKAFKRAAGFLLKRRLVTIDASGHLAPARRER